MINLASTTNFKVRMPASATSAEKKAQLDTTIRGLRTVDAQTTRPLAESFKGARLQEDGSFAGMQFTKEGFRALCGTVSSNLYGLLGALDRTDGATPTQVKIFNEALALNEHNLENQHLVVREKSGVGHQIEAVHSKSYGYISNLDALDILLSRGHQGSDLETVRIHGRKMDVMMSNPEMVVTVPTARSPEGEDIIQTQYINNSEDGSSRLMAGVGLYTFFCTNGMRIGQEFEMVNAVHRGDMAHKVRMQMSKLNGVDVQGVFEKIKASSEITLGEGDLANAQRFLNTRVGKKLSEHFTSLERKFVSDDLPMTGYELFNGITEYAHKQPDLDEQLKLETVGYQYLDKLVGV